MFELYCIVVIAAVVAGVFDLRIYDTAHIPASISFHSF